MPYQRGSDSSHHPECLSKRNFFHHSSFFSPQTKMQSHFRVRRIRCSPSLPGSSCFLPFFQCFLPLPRRLCPSQEEGPNKSPLNCVLFLFVLCFCLRLSFFPRWNHQRYKNNTKQKETRFKVLCGGSIFHGGRGQSTPHANCFFERAPDDSVLRPLLPKVGGLSKLSPVKRPHEAPRWTKKSDRFRVICFIDRHHEEASWSKLSLFLVSDGVRVYFAMVS